MSEQPFFGKISEKVINLREKLVRQALASHSGEVPLAELKAQPRQGPKTSMNDFIQTHDKQKVYTQALEQAQREQEITKPEPINSATSSESEEDDSSEEAARRGNKFGVKTGISPATVQAIQFKQKAENEMKSKTSDLLEQQDSAKNQETLIKISEQIRNIFQFETGSKKFMVKIIDMMMQGNMRGNFVSRGKSI